MTPLQHFVALARRGRHAGASGGEYRCYTLALSILETAYGIDSQAIDGMAEFARWVSADYHTAAEAIGPLPPVRHPGPASDKSTSSNGGANEPNQS